MTHQLEYWMLNSYPYYVIYANFAVNSWKKENWFRRVYGHTEVIQKFLRCRSMSSKNSNANPTENAYRWKWDQVCTINGLRPQPANVKSLVSDFFSLRPPISQSVVNGTTPTMTKPSFYITLVLVIKSLWLPLYQNTEVWSTIRHRYSRYNNTKYSNNRFFGNLGRFWIYCYEDEKSSESRYIYSQQNIAHAIVFSERYRKLGCTI